MRISLYVEMNFPAIMRFKQCFLWNVVLGAKTQHNVLTPSTATANADRAPFSHIHICGHELRNMWVCGTRRGRRRWIQKLLFLKKCFLFIKIRTVHGYTLPPHSESWRWFTFDNNCECSLWSKCIWAFHCHEESSVSDLKKLRYLLYKGRNRFYLALYSQHTVWHALYITRATNVYWTELKLYELVNEKQLRTNIYWSFIMCQADVLFVLPELSQFILAIPPQNLYVFLLIYKWETELQG